MMELAERVAWAIKQTGEKHEELAVKLGVHKNTITAYKKCEGDLKGVVLTGLVLHYGFNPVWLLTGNGPPYQSDEQTAPIKNLYGVQEDSREYSANSSIRVNEALDNIKRMDSHVFQKLVDHIESVEWGLRMIAGKGSHPESSCDRRQKDEPDKIPGGVDRRNSKLNTGP